MGIYICMVGRWPIRAPTIVFFYVFDITTSPMFLLSSLVGNTLHSLVSNTRIRRAAARKRLRLFDKIEALSRGAWRTNRRTAKSAIDYATQWLAD